MKRLLSVAVILLMSAVFLFMMSAASFGEETAFSYTIEDVTMTITGNGAVPDYFYYELDYNVREAIQYIVIEEGITEIGDRAFCYFYALRDVSLPNSLESIGEAAFDVCRSLSDITLPKGLKSIGNYAFTYCRSITEMVIPESVTYLGYHIFDHATSLSSVTLPSHLTALPPATFHYCESLNEIELPAGITEIGDSAFSYSGIESIVIPEGVTLIPERAFECCPRLASVTLPDNIEKIDKYGFYYTPSLTSIDLPQDLRVIEYAAFSRSGLSGDLIIPEGVEEIYWKAFYETKISTLSLPSTLTYMDYAIFGMTDLTEISVAEGNTVYASYQGCLYSKDLSVLYMYTNGDGKTEIIVPPSVTYIDGYAFGGNHLEKLYLPFGLLTLHNEANAESGYYETPPYYCYRGTPAYDYLSNSFTDDKIGFLEIQDISVENMPYRTEYAIGESFNSLGLTASVTDAFGGISYHDSNFVVGEHDFSSEGQVSVPVSLWGYEFEVPVRVGADVCPYPESLHPYENDSDLSWTYTYHLKCDSLKLSFSEECNTEDGYDFITIIDSNQNTVGSYCGSALAGKVIELPGNSFTITLTSDASKEDYGFTIDRIEAVGVVYDPEITVDNYTVTITSANYIKDMRYAPGEYTTTTEIRNAEGNVAISNTLVQKYTVDGKFVYEMPKGGYYTIWIRMTDGTSHILPLDVTNFTPTVTANGVTVTVNNLYNVKDLYIAKGEYNSYREIKDNGYIFSATGTKIADKHNYTHVVYEPGIHTVLIRYNDGTQAIFHQTLTVDEPIFTKNGLQLTVSNIPDVRVIRTAYGEWNTVKELKATDTLRNFSAKTTLKGKDAYTIQYREEGVVTVTVEYNNGYMAVYHYNVQKKIPTVTQSGNSVTFGELDDLVVLRYAPGEYSTMAEIKRAPGSKYLKPNDIADGVINVSDLAVGTYTFCVQYDDESYNYYTIIVE